MAPFTVLSVLLRKRCDLIFGGNGLMAPICWVFGKVFGMPALCYVHGLDVVVPSRLYQAVFVPCLRRLDSILVNSNNTRRLCIDAGVDEEKISVIHPGCEIPAEIDRESARRYLQERSGAVGDFFLLFVGRVAPRKGLLAFMQNGFAALLRRRPDTVLVIAGDSPGDSLAHRSNEMANVLLEVEGNGWKNRVLFLGKVDNDTLSKCYAGADCLLFPLVPVVGDVEGFGMVAIEAAAHGTPTVAFAEGGVVDAVNDGVSGSLVAPGDYDAMIDAVVRVRRDITSVVTCQSHALKFSWQIFDGNISRSIYNLLSD
jgi:phosphatidylinositol alpha-1,6-mannosyltransferase